MASASALAALSRRISSEDIRFCSVNSSSKCFSYWWRVTLLLRAEKSEKRFAALSVNRNTPRSLRRRTAWTRSASHGCVSNQPVLAESAEEESFCCTSGGKEEAL